MALGQGQFIQGVIPKAVCRHVAKLTHALHLPPEAWDGTKKKPRLLPGLVRKKGLEPPRLAAPDPKSGAATNYATSALGAQI